MGPMIRIFQGLLFFLSQDENLDRVKDKKVERISQLAAMRKVNDPVDQPVGKML